MNFNIDFHTAHSNDTNCNLFSKLSYDNYLPWLSMCHGTDNITLYFKLHEDDHKHIILTLTIHSHAFLCVCFYCQKPEGHYANVGVGGSCLEALH